jgi:hypothetical protein
MIAVLLAAAAVAAAPTPSDEAQKMQDLQVLWNQSCGSAAYGSYNDICNSLKAQMRAYQKKQGKKTTLPPPAADTMPTVAEAKPKS